MIFFFGIFLIFEHTRSENIFKRVIKRKEKTSNDLRNLFLKSFKLTQFSLLRFLPFAEKSHQSDFKIKFIANKLCRTLEKNSLKPGRLSTHDINISTHGVPNLQFNLLAIDTDHSGSKLNAWNKANSLTLLGLRNTEKFLPHCTYCEIMYRLEALVGKL